MVDLVSHNVRRGTAAVEAALMMPLVMFMTFALVNFGWLFIKSGQINNAARQGVRVAARADSTTAAVEAHIETLMGNAGISYDTATVLVVESSIPLDNEDPPATGTIVTVTITVPYRGTALDLIPLPLLFLVPVELQSVATMLKEGLAG